MPVYNRESFVEQSVRSILNQDYEHFELIVVDDGSTDNSGQILKSLVSESKGKLRYFHKANGERGAARNYGAAEAKAEMLNFFDSDDLMYPNHLREANQFLNENPGTIWFHQHYDYRLGTKSVQIRNYFKGDRNKALIDGNDLSCNGVFIRKEIFLQERFCEERKLAGLEDWELWLRLASKYPLYCTEKITTSIVQHDERSVLDKNPEKLICRVNCLISQVKKDPTIMKYMGKRSNRFFGSCYSYLALHLALMKNQRILSLKYLFMSISRHPAILVRRRFLAILKHWF